MKLTELLRELQRRDVRLYLQDGRLRCKAPRDALSADLRTAIDAHNSELRTFLAPKNEDFQTIAPVPRTGPLPLSFAQQRLWFHHQLNTDSTVYNIPSAARLVGRLDTVALERSLNELVRRHEILRTTYQHSDELPVQEITPHHDLPFPVQDLRALTRAQQTEATNRIALEESERPFDLATGPMLRTRLLILLLVIAYRSMFLSSSSITP